MDTELLFYPVAMIVIPLTLWLARLAVDWVVERVEARL